MNLKSIYTEEIQKHTSLFVNMTEANQIKDQSVIKKLAGKYKDRVQKSEIAFEDIKQFSKIEATGEKYGLIPHSIKK